MQEFIEIGSRKKEFVSKNISMELVSACKQFIEQEKLCDVDRDKILVAVSGGRDSVSLLYILYELGYDVGIAHLNHGLRGKESDEEQSFVHRLSMDLDIPFHTEKVNINSIVEKQKKNLQDAARIERYRFFNETVQLHNYTKIATAHHLEDNIESFLFHFTRGSGLRGLSGIPSIRGIIIRPFLGVKRSDIDRYIQLKAIEFREDSSNIKTTYKRNFLRHEVVPKLSQVHPNFLSNAKTSLHILSMTNAYYRDQMKASIQSIMNVDSKYFRINKQKIYDDKHGALILFEILNPFGFNGDQVVQILNSEKGNGQLYYSKTYELLSDRDSWIMRKLTDQKPATNVKLENGMNEIAEIGSFTIETTSTIIEDLSTKYTLYADAKKLEFPLTLRTWKPGDYFFPLHMKGKKQKLKEFFVNNKLNRFEKDEVLIVLSKGQIIWLIGHRMDDRFKVDTQTEEICQIKFQPIN